MACVLACGSGRHITDFSALIAPSAASVVITKASLRPMPKCGASSFSVRGKLRPIPRHSQTTRRSPVRSEVQLWRVVFGAASGAPAALRTMPNGCASPIFLRRAIANVNAQSETKHATRSMASPNEVEPLPRDRWSPGLVRRREPALENQSLFWTCTRGSASRPVSAGRARFCFESRCRRQRDLGWDTYEMRWVDANHANRQLRPDEGYNALRDSRVWRHGEQETSASSASGVYR